MQNRRQIKTSTPIYMLWRMHTERTLHPLNSPRCMNRVLVGGNYTVPSSNPLHNGIDPASRYSFEESRNNLIYTDEITMTSGSKGKRLKLEEGRYLRIVPQLFRGVASMTPLSSICLTPQRGSSRRRRLGLTKGGSLWRETCTCIPAGKQRMTKP